LGRFNGLHPRWGFRKKLGLQSSHLAGESWDRFMQSMCA
jgi:hypothetical protein